MQIQYLSLYYYYSCIKQGVHIQLFIYLLSTFLFVVNCFCCLALAPQPMFLLPAEGLSFTLLTLSVYTTNVCDGICERESIESECNSTCIEGH